MTLNTLHSLTDNELKICMYVVNDLFPIDMVKIEKPIGLTWLRRGALEYKLLNAFDKIKEEYYSDFFLLLKKLNIKFIPLLKDAEPVENKSLGVPATEQPAEK